MQIHELKPLTKSKKKKRVGRGGKRGTYSGRGMKGQKSRAGRKIKSQLREAILKFPKKRGLKFKKVTKREIIEVKLKDILEKFPEGGEITPKILEEKGLIEIPKSKKFFVKILGKEKINVPLKIKHCLVTQSAKESIINAGGTIKE
ncbi:MAG: uL15 family ribosomal protein [Candidatus Paceibacterota bacterium]